MHMRRQYCPPQQSKCSLYVPSRSAPSASAMVTFPPSSFQLRASTAQPRPRSFRDGGKSELHFPLSRSSPRTRISASQVLDSNTRTSCGLYRSLICKIENSKLVTHVAKSLFEFPSKRVTTKRTAHYQNRRDFTVWTIHKSLPHSTGVNTFSTNVANRRSEQALVCVETWTYRLMLLFSRSVHWRRQGNGFAGWLQTHFNTVGNGLLFRHNRIRIKIRSRRHGTFLSQHVVQSLNVMDCILHNVQRRQIAVCANTFWEQRVKLAEQLVDV